jgi:NAD(P)-dependent dehydrogenase (short-subunit alcohol dehydrogenase family)
MAKNVFLTGASSGIGRAAAVALTEAGYNVWGTSREISRLPVLPRLRPVQLDLASPESIRQGFAGALEQAAHFDVLINNAGSGHFGPAENLSHDAIAAQFQVLLFGQLQLMQLALPGMKARRRGMIINVS